MTLRWRRIGLAVVGSVLLGATVPGGALPGGASADSWWILLADRPEVPDADWDDPAFDGKARACGLDPFTTQSAAFLGFAPGRILVIHLKAYPTKAAARDDLATARRCLGGASLRRGRLVLE